MNGRWYAVAGIAFAGAALGVSLTGAADGAVQAKSGPPTTKQIKTIAKKQANRAITSRAPTLTVAKAGGAAPTGPAGGNLAGTYPNPVVAAGAITGSHLAAEAVGTTQLRDGAVTTAKLADGSITESKFAGPVIAARDLTNGAVLAHALGPIDSVTDIGSVPAGSTAGVTATCPEATRLISGGGVTVANLTTMRLIGSYPVNNGWRVVFHNGGGAAADVTAYAQCLEAIGG